MGRPKEWLPIGAERMLHRVVRLVGEAVDVVVVAAAPGQTLPELPATVRVVRDTRANQGPLRGLATGLAAFPEVVDLVYVSATDAPFLQPGWVARLAELVEGHDLAIPRANGFSHPLAAIYRREPVLEMAETLLAAGHDRLLNLLEPLRSRFIEGTDLFGVDPDLRSLRNLNSPEDYRNAVDAWSDNPPSLAG